MRKSSSRKLLELIKSYRFLLATSILLSFVAVFGQLYIPILFGDAIDDMLGRSQVQMEPIFQILLQIGGLLVVVGLSLWISNRINNRVAFSIVRDLRAKSIRKIQNLPISYLDAHSAGDIVQRMIADTDQISDGLLLGFTQLFSGVLTIFLTLYFLFSKSGWITLLVILLTPMSFFVARFIASRSYQLFKSQNEVRGKQTAYINEMISSQKVVKAFGHEQEAIENFDELNQSLQNEALHATFYSSLTNPSTRFVNNIIYALVALLGAYMIVHGRLTVGGLTVVLSYCNQYMKPFNDISSVVTELQNSFACADRVFELLDQEEEVETGRSELTQVEGNIHIEHVDFSYVKEKPLIQDFDLDVKSGSRIAIVGPTGCGKTTFINLLMRFYDVDRGRIYIDGTDIYTLSRKSLRSQFGMVLQDTWIQKGTIRENILIGKKDATQQEIIEACKQSRSWSFIRRMPQGLDTLIDEQSLSQGQKQLLCITRVMLMDPPMLILDEATSSIDTRTEIQVQRAFDTLMEGRTSFIVAHRLSTIESADLILVMKDGSIIERGNHQTLLEMQGFYASLYASQFERG